jgi:hypothetical protein
MSETDSSLARHECRQVAGRVTWEEIARVARRNQQTNMQILGRLNSNARLQKRLNQQENIQ